MNSMTPMTVIACYSSDVHDSGLSTTLTSNMFKNKDYINSVSHQYRVTSVVHLQGADDFVVVL